LDVLLKKMECPHSWHYDGAQSICADCGSIQAKQGSDFDSGTKRSGSYKKSPMVDSLLRDIDWEGLGIEEKSIRDEVTRHFKNKEESLKGCKGLAVNSLAHLIQDVSLQYQKQIRLDVICGKLGHVKAGRGNIFNDFFTKYERTILYMECYSSNVTELDKAVEYMNQNAREALNSTPKTSAAYFVSKVNGRVTKDFLRDEGLSETCLNTIFSKLQP